MTDDIAPQDESANFDGDRFQILALDGGGAKALFTANVLARLERDLGVRLVDHFDLIAGTSAGGIIALGLGAGLSPAEIADNFRGLVASVFPSSRRRSPTRVLRPAYRADALRTAVTDVLGDRLLLDSRKRLVVPSWDVQMGTVHIFKTPHHASLTRDWQIPMVDVAMATAAAPTYFPAAKVDGQRLIDGGVWANNPSVVAIGEAVSVLDANLRDIRVLNVGTMDALDAHPKRLDRGGLLSWAKPAVPLVLAASSRGAQGTAMHMVGKDRYHRFDARVPGGLYSLDKIDPDDLDGIAAQVSRMISPTYSQHFAPHTARPYAALAGAATTSPQQEATP